MQPNTHTNGSPIGLYMHPATAAHLLKQSQLLRAQVLRKRAIIEAGAEFILRGPDRRVTESMADTLAMADRRHNAERRFTPTPL